MGATFWLRIGAIWGLLSVAMGAFGAHGLRTRFESMGSVPGAIPTARLNETFHTASQYQMYCALAIVAVGLMAQWGRTGMAIETAGWLFLVGSVLFSGSLYLLCITGKGWYGAITPIGGLLMMAGWIAMAIAAGASGKAPGGEILP